MKKLKYRIIGVISIITIVACFAVVTPIYAEEGKTTTETTEALDCVDLAEKYGLYVDESGEGNNKYVVVFDSSHACGNTDVIKNYKYQVIKINEKKITNGAILSQKNNKVTVTSDKEEEVKVTLKNLNVKNEEITVEFFYTSEEKGEGSVPTLDDNKYYNTTCKTLRGSLAGDPDKLDFFKSSLPYCWNTKVVTNYTEKELRAKIDVLKSKWELQKTTGGSQAFNDAFNYIKTQAEKKSLGEVNTLAVPSSTTIPLYCDYKLVTINSGEEMVTYENKYGEKINANGDIVDDKGEVLISDGSDDYAYLNKDYFYTMAHTKVGDDTLKYTYNYAPGNTKEIPAPEKTKDYGTCIRTCMETVKVEYGPPIASKAGLCFEYQVKVTSYVKCSSKMNVEPPTYPTTYCNPAPRCKSSSGVLRKLEQAGPTEDFEACIQKCDGGKYTEKCSLKCYKEVYGESSSSSKLALNYETVQATKLANKDSYSIDQCLKDNKDYYGCYAYNGSTINWHSNVSYNANSKLSLGRWYLDRVNSSGYDHSKGGYDISGITSSGCSGKYSGCYIADPSGFYRESKSGVLCTDNCIWRTDQCSETEYLNPGTALADYKANMTLYENAVAECNAAATCSERTANFTISINYDKLEKNDSGTEVRKTTKIDFPYSTKADKLKANKSGENEKVGINPESILLDYDGCYKDSTIGNKYMTEWSFPGTYIHNKTGEISYEPPEDDSGWYYDDQKFCMPLNALSVNTKWWEWYKISNKKFKNEGGCYTAEQIEEELKGTSGTSNGYNINATATDFGHFGWNFDIKCFYGLRNETCNKEKTEACCPKTPSTTTGLDYTIRSVDINNLFPNTKEEDVVDETKREIGFNWTEKSISTKNDEYSINPPKLREHIETTANTLYSDESNLDYQFYLTPTTLQKIREYNNKIEYNTWCGTTDEKNGIHVYSSNLFRTTLDATKCSGVKSNIISDSEAIKTGAIGVNNENYIEFGG